jgi:Na+-translocating ferredoxin:NAD+ oxidoreductase RnfD subunit
VSVSQAQPWAGDKRLGGLRRFAVAITILNILGHTVFGFEQSWAQPFVALAAAYGMELLIETMDARNRRRRPRYAGSLRHKVDFMLSAHISGLAVSMLLYANERLAVMALAAAVAIASKAFIRVPLGGAMRHVFNPSNLGITVTLLVFPWVGIAPPYAFTENLYGIADWILPAVIVVSGTFVNARFTGRLPLIAAWLSAFALQALARSLVLGTPVPAALVPMTGTAFILYTFYMVTDPATTPSAARGQVLFGTAVAMTYGLLMTVHVVFGLFFALTFVSGARGLALAVGAYLRGGAFEHIVAGPRRAAVPGGEVPAMVSPRVP